MLQYNACLFEYLKEDSVRQAYQLRSFHFKDLSINKMALVQNESKDLWLLKLVCLNDNCIKSTGSHESGFKGPDMTIASLDRDQLYSLGKRIVMIIANCRD